MELNITITVQVPDGVESQTVLDEITSNLESCGWDVLRALVEGQDLSGRS